jgi:molecular chaperone GrpE
MAAAKNYQPEENRRIMGVQDDEQVPDVEQPEVEGTTEQVTEEPEDEVASLLQELEDSRCKQAEYLDGWQRSRAELANARRRFQREQEQAYANARTDVLVRLLPVVDDLERAFDAVPRDQADKDWLEGVKLVLHKFKVVLKQEGVEPIEAVGHEFNPYYHQAVTHEPSETVPEGHVIQEVQKGYRVDDRVLRPSIVRVSSGPLVEPEAGAAEDSPGEGSAVEEEQQQQPG